jgi:predicted DNA-binding transcriptional regulator YafY
VPTSALATPIALDLLLVALPPRSRIASIVRARVGPARTTIHPATLRVLSRVLVVGTPPAGAGHMSARTEEIFAACETAFLEHKVLLLSYVDGHGRASDRAVEAHGLALRVTGWSILALVRTAGEPRAFRLDRMRSARVQTERFSPLDPRTFA